MTTIQKKRGDTWKFKAWIRDDNGIAIADFSDWEIWLTIKRQDSDSDPDAVAQITLSGGGIAITNSGNAEVTGTFDAEVTSEIPVKNYVADWQARSNSGVVKSSETFTIKCVADITGAT